MKFQFNTLYLAQVINNNDPAKEGRVQIYIPSLMSGWKTELLPWARPFLNSTGGDGTDFFASTACDTAENDESNLRFGQSFIPETQTSIWIWFEKEEEAKNPYYLTGLQLKATNPHRVFEDKLKPSLLEIGIQSTYPDTKFTILKNKLFKFFSSKKKLPEAGTILSKDNYFFQQDNQTVTGASVQKTVLKTGTTQKLEMNASTTLQETKLQTDPANYVLIRSLSGVPAIELKAGQTTPTEKMILGETLKAKLEELIDAIKALTVNTGVGPSSTPNNASQFDSIKFSLNTILSDYIKNN